MENGFRECEIGALYGTLVVNRLALRKKALFKKYNYILSFFCVVEIQHWTGDRII